MDLRRRLGAGDKDHRLEGREEVLTLKRKYKGLEP